MIIESLLPSSLAAYLINEDLPAPERPVTRRDCVPFKATARRRKFCPKVSVWTSDEALVGFVSNRGTSTSPIQAVELDRSSGSKLLLAVQPSLPI